MPLSNLLPIAFIASLRMSSVAWRPTGYFTLTVTTEAAAAAARQHEDEDDFNSCSS